MHGTASSSTTSGQYGGGGTVAPASNLTYYGISDASIFSAFRQGGRSVTVSSASQWLPYHGFVATTSTGPIATLNKSDIRAFTTSSGAGAASRLYWNYIRDIVT